MYNKQQLVMMELARELISYEVGDRIDTISSYTKRFDTSRGVVQEALNTLEEEKAITRDKKGTLGTFLSNINYKKLWIFTLGRIAGVSPLPYTKKHEGIATAIYNEMEKENIPFNFAYMQGAEKRIQCVLEGKYDFAVLSKESACTLIKKYNNIKIVMEFAQYSYLSGYALLYKDKDVLKKKKLRVGRDLASSDHTKWMELLAKENELELEYIDIQYTQMVPAIMNGIIDGTIYNKDTIEKPGIFGDVYFEDLVINKDIGDETRAVLVISNKSLGFSNLLNQIINEKEVTITQKQVIDGVRDPVY